MTAVRLRYTRTDLKISSRMIPGLIAVNASGNLYVGNKANSSIVVFRATDSGAVVPAKTIAGLTLLLTDKITPAEKATESAANLYVSCLCTSFMFGVLEFDPGANGDVAPIRVISGSSTPEMYWNYNLGLAVDSAETIT